MHILKLPWLRHTAENKDVEVYSVSVSSDGSRLASGGLDGKVRIWSIDTIKKFKDSTKNVIDEDECRPLCSMSRHNGAVTVVRFSPSGRFLATGSDDKILLIWEKDDEQPKGFNQSFGLEQDQDLEHWTVRKRVVAHDNDIQDIAWAPDSSILVTVGLDRSIIIWNGATFERIKRYDIHQSHVKGIVFDPANKYFVTASDDRTVRIFRYHRSSPTEMTFSIEHVVMEPFKKSPLTSYFRRLSWSPDGQHIAVPNATNGPVSSCVIINRGNWDSDISLIGHNSPCEVCSFSPRLFEIQDEKLNEPKLSTIVATAGQDKTLAIWNTYRSRPLVIATDICFKTITDMAWTPDGETLFVSSLDGSITCICFDTNELGIAVPLERNDEQLNRYGADRESMVFPESTQQLILEEKSELELKNLNEIKMNSLMGVVGPINNRNLEKNKIENKIESKIEKKDPITPFKTSKINNLTPKQINKLTNSITVTKDGKKRVTPILISSTSQPTNLKFAQASISSSARISKDTTKLISQQSFQLPRFGIQSAIHGLKEKVEDVVDEVGDIDTIESHAKVTQPKPIQSSLSKRKHESDDYPSFIKRSLNNPISVGSNSVVVVISYCPDLQNQSILEIRNSEDEDDPTTVISNDFNGNRKFELYFPSKISHGIGYNNEYWVLASVTGSISIFSSEGRLLFPSIELGAKISVLKCNKQYLLAVSCIGMIYVWDIKKFKNVFNEVPVASVLNSLTQIIKNEKKQSQFQQPPQINLVEISSSGLPYIFLDNHEAYSYSSDLNTWIKISDPWYFKVDNDYLGNNLLGIAQNRASKSMDAKYITDNDEFKLNVQLSYLEIYRAVMETLKEEGLDEIDDKIRLFTNQNLVKLDGIRDL